MILLFWHKPYFQ